MTGMGAGLTWGSALIEWNGAFGLANSDQKGAVMSKVAFCFPGQGSLEAGMGKDIAEAVPAAREVYRVGSEAPGSTSSTSASRRRSRSSSKPRCSSRRSSLPASPSSLRCASAGFEPDVVVGHSVGEFAALASVGAIGIGRGDRARSGARPRDGRSGAAAPGLDGGDPRPRGRAGRDALPQDPRRLARELQLPRADRRLRRERGGRGVLRRGREPRRPTSDQAQGVGRIPQPARRRGRPTA